MPWNANGKLEPRGEKDPKFDPHNKTDRKIVLTVVIAVSILLVVVGGLFSLYFFVFK